MARITTTYCERIVPNRFELVVLAAARARELLRGDEPGVPADGDRQPVIALREIAAQKLGLIELRRRLLPRWLDGAEKAEKPETSVRIGPCCNEVYRLTGITSDTGAVTTASPSREVSLTQLTKNRNVPCSTALRK
ncbi:MAG: DNA-directed RNA polymerase subunit omega [Beijerinckiaceae bacterium]